ncbi:MAG TPA: creatininase family protein [bacterium]|nr:creatininase family protein [bacterium]
MDKNKRKTGFPVMEEMTVKMVREYLGKNKSIVLPVGLMEQHGYHLPLITDALVAKETGRMAAERLGILMAPVLCASFSGGNLPGTINISPAVTSLIVNDTLVSLASQGFKKIYIILGHGGGENLNALNIGLRVLLNSNPVFSDVLLALLPAWSFDESGIGWKKALKEKDYHAGWLETSIVMALAPELVHMEEMELDEKPAAAGKEDPENYMQAEKIVNDPMVIARVRQKKAIKVGVHGYPPDASPELGRKLVEETVALMVKKISELERKYDGKYKKVRLIQDPPAA